MLANLQIPDHSFSTTDLLGDLANQSVIRDSKTARVDANSILSICWRAIKGNKDEAGNLGETWN